MDIGVEQETIVIEPIESPAPGERAPAPKEPVIAPEREIEETPELVPA